ncbi:M56 family metallopeptidase [Paenibacillus sp. SYP-B4298]|uniref:M56 family metallopeptidase n=1 Tax=Paenibacillus sp. SYP-B4298 TaxID=2996034 RepID=UPI0022DD9C1E|nr:M56 family metallopeptidase [Paenibacillus sp. SYP-B4298]
MTNSMTREGTSLMWWRKKCWLALALSLSIALLVWTQMGMYAIHLLFGTHLHINVFQLCTSLFRENSLLFYTVQGMLSGLIVYTVLMTIYHVIQQGVQLTKFNIRLAVLRDEQRTGQLADALGLEQGRLAVIRQEQPLAFTVGFWRPVIVLSSGLLALLNEEELEAVIEHESFHQKNKDACKLWTLRLIAEGLWFIPLTRWSYQSYHILSEVLADQYAISRMGTARGLGSALLKLIRIRMPMEGAAAVSFSGGSINYRLQQLLQPQQQPPVRLEKAALLISVVVLLLLMTMFLLAIA